MGELDMDILSLSGTEIRPRRTPKRVSLLIEDL
jgi:hypothetical protein